MYKNFEKNKKEKKFFIIFRNVLMLTLFSVQNSRISNGTFKLP